MNKAKSLFCKWAVRRGNYHVPETGPASKEHLSPGLTAGPCEDSLIHLPLEILWYRMGLVCSEIRSYILNTCPSPPKKVSYYFKSTLRYMCYWNLIVWASQTIELNSELFEGRIGSFRLYKLPFLALCLCSLNTQQLLTLSRIKDGHGKMRKGLPKISLTS